MPDVKETYEKKLPLYQKAVAGVSETLAKLLENEKIHSIKYRVKTFESFLDKITVKQYQKPFTDCTDIAGCRVICLFKDQLPKIAKKIEKKYDVLETVISEESSNQFSYQKYHIIVRVGSLACEIQLRTIVQEAWAEIEHYINYSQMIGAEPKLVRKINALSALFEIADDQFRDIHITYQDTLKQPVKSTEITPVALYHYCKKTFPWAWKEKQLFDDLENIQRYATVAKQCIAQRITSIAQLDELYQQKKKAIEKEESFHIQDIRSNPKQWPALHERIQKTKHFFSPIVIMGLVLSP